MTAIRARFDGRVLAPEEPVELPVNQPLNVYVESAGTAEAPLKELARVLCEKCQTTRRRHPASPPSTTTAFTARPSGHDPGFLWTTKHLCPCQGRTNVGVMKFTAVNSPDEQTDWLVAECPEVGAASQGKTEEEALANLKDATGLYLESFPQAHPRSAKLASIELSNA